MERQRRVAVLMIQGILGTIAHFTPPPFLPLIPTDWTVHNLLLEGHEGRVKDFLHASMGMLFALQEAVQ